MRNFEKKIYIQNKKVKKIASEKIKRNSKKNVEKFLQKKNLDLARRRAAAPPSHPAASPPRPRCRGARIRSPRAAAAADPGPPKRGGGARRRSAPLRPLRRCRSRSPPPRRSPPSAPPSPLAVPAAAARGPRHRAARLGWGEAKLPSRDSQIQRESEENRKEKEGAWA